MSLPEHTEKIHLTHPKYRADIDGLRAIAILSVVGFHALPEWVKGGFIGVDIFFVISGYLISTIIFDSLERNSFSYIQFYSRRIKRIFPALILVMASCYALGWYVLFPDEYLELGKHIAGGAGFISNIILWKESGYFDTAAETKPLLHLWSLGIEEQYYIFAPLIMAFVWRRRWSFLWVTVIIAVLSFAANIYYMYRYPTSSFYLPLPRFWELMAGGILAYINLHKGHLLKAQKNAQSIIGVILIMLGMVLIDRQSAFPGWWALFPTLGAFFVISGGAKAWFNHKLLSNKILIWCGLISYPLYLWHWPLLSFARIVEGGTPSFKIRIAAITLSFVLAWLTYRLVEKPIRLANLNRVAITLAALMTIVGLTGYTTFKNGGLVSRQLASDKLLLLKDFEQQDLSDFYCPSDIKASLPFLSFCKTSSELAPSVALVGDSHANHLFPGIPYNDRSNRWILLGIHSCPPTIGIVAEGSNPGCEEKFEGLFKYLAQDGNTKLVVLSFFGEYANETYFSADAIQRHGSGLNQYILKSDVTSNREDALYFGLDNSIKLLNNSGKRVVIALDVPELPFLPRDCIRMSSDDNYSETCSVPKLNIDGRQTTIRRIIARLKENYPNLLVYDPINVLCTTQRCYAFDHGRSYYMDSHHLSVFGSDVIGRDFNNWLVNQDLNLN